MNEYCCPHCNKTVFRDSNKKQLKSFCSETGKECVIYRKREDVPPSTPDSITNPSHYTSHPSGVECIQITEHFNFNIGNAIKYLWRAGLKGDAIEDLEKARWYVSREIERRKVEKL